MLKIINLHTGTLIASYYDPRIHHTFDPKPWARLDENALAQKSFEHDERVKSGQEAFDRMMKAFDQMLSVINSHGVALYAAIDTGDNDISNYMATDG